MEGFIQLVTVIAIFLIVLAVTYFTTRFVGGYAKNRIVTGNIELIDSMKIAPSAYIAIVRTASKYMALGIGKNEIHFLCELPEDAIEVRETGTVVNYNFRELVEKAREKIGKK
ncbi:MAG: flagellar biosynthetic protein FliO [Lachnospiraceae bacterium]|nr:flagellar biosynthetic protein FliO [Lachnospiraceae bacterium]